MTRNRSNNPEVSNKRIPIDTVSDAIGTGFQERKHRHKDLLPPVNETYRLRPERSKRQNPINVVRKDACRRDSEKGRDFGVSPPVRHSDVMIGASGGGDG